MFSTRSLTLVAMATLASTSVSAAELVYKWKKGDVHRFRYEATTAVEMKMPGMGSMMGGAGGMTVRTDTVFSQKVTRVRANGTADVELTVEKLDFYQGGRKTAGLARIPARARKIRAEVDKKGRAKFYEMVTIYVKDNNYYVGVHKASVGPRGASASASAGDHDVEVVASVDPKTGRVEAKMTIKERKPKLRKVKIKREDPAIDVLPKEIFEMLVLPDGDISEDTKVDIKTPFGPLSIAVTDWSKRKVSFRTRVAASASADADDDGAKVKTGQGAGGMPDLGSMMGGMMGGAPGGGGGAGGSASSGASAGMALNVDATTGFDHKKGRLLRIKGKLGSTMSVGGMGSIKTTTDFRLKRH